MIDPDLFEPYDRLIRIEVLGQPVEVPENNCLLRCFQYLSLRSISYGDFCWNGDCANCQFWYRDDQTCGDEGIINEDAMNDDAPAAAAEGEAPDKTALSCRFKVREGLVVTRLHPSVRLENLD